MLDLILERTNLHLETNQETKIRRHTEKCHIWGFLAVRWLGLEAFASRGRGPIPGGGPRILHAACHPTPSKRVAFDP